MMNVELNVKKGDEVIVLSGKDRGKKGKILEALPKDGRVIIEGRNIRVRFRRAKRKGEKGQRLELPAPLAISKIMLVCPHCGKPTRVSHEIKSEGRFRKCKKCGKVIS